MWTTKEGCIAASMTLMLSIPTDPHDATKKIDIKIDPSTKNITVTGVCPTNSYYDYSVIIITYFIFNVHNF